MQQKLPGLLPHTLGHPSRVDPMPWDKNQSDLQAAPHASSSISSTHIAHELIDITDSWKNSSSTSPIMSALWEIHRGTQIGLNTADINI